MQPEIADQPAIFAAVPVLSYANVCHLAYLACSRHIVYSSSILYVCMLGVSVAGDSKESYMLFMCKKAKKMGWRSVAMNYRSVSIVLTLVIAHAFYHTHC